MNLFWFFSKDSNEERSIIEESDRGSKLVIMGTLLVLVVFVCWALWAEIDEITRAPGTVIASSRTQLIQSQDGGTLEALMVQEGDIVEAGQLLALIDSTRAEASYLETRATVAGLTARVSRLRSEVLDQPIVFPQWLDQYAQMFENQVTLQRRRSSALTEELDALQRVREILLEELAMNEPLVAAGDVSRTELLRLERQTAEAQAQITNKRNNWFQDAQAELSDAETELRGLEQQLVQRKNLLDQTKLTSPLKGIVKDVQITTIGGVIRPGEDVMQIVPIEEALLIEAKVSPADIAFLHKGLEASVKIDAYDSTIYGDLTGRLIFLSADTLKDNLQQNEQPYYRVRVRTDGRRFSSRPDEQLDIQAGMTATIEIKTGRRTVMQYLTKPIIKTFDESLGER